MSKYQNLMFWYLSIYNHKIKQKWPGPVIQVALKNLLKITPYHTMFFANLNLTIIAAQTRNQTFWLGKY